MEKMEEFARRFSIRFFFATLFLYWCLIAVLDPDKEVAKYGSVYWLYISPVFFLLLVFGIYALINFNKYLSDFLFAREWWLRLFVLWFVATVAISLVNKDWSALRIVIPWALIISSLVVVKIPFKISCLNVFFLFSLASSVVGYHLGLSQFGYLLGQSKWNCFSLDRVSLYPSLFDSAFISFIFLVLNYFYNKSRTKYLIYLISAYFIMFSASRTIYLCVMIFVFFVFLKSVVREKLLMVFAVVAIVATAISLMVILNPKALLDKQLVGRFSFFDKYVFHKSEHEFCNIQGAGDQDVGQVGTSAAKDVGQVGTSAAKTTAPYYHIYGRGELLRQMYTEFTESPILGSGQAFRNKPSTLPDRAGGTESFIAGLFVRFGFLSALFVLSFCALAYSLFEKKAYAEFILTISAIVSWALFGSSASIYNFNFLLTISLILSADSRLNSQTKSTTQNLN